MRPNLRQDLSRRVRSAPVLAAPTNPKSRRGAVVPSPRRLRAMPGASPARGGWTGLKHRNQHQRGRDEDHGHVGKELPHWIGSVVMRRSRVRVVATNARFRSSCVGLLDHFAATMTVSASRPFAE